MEDVTRISQSEPVTPEKSGLSVFGRSRQKKKKHSRKAKKHVAELSTLVDETHKELEKSNSPFRLCIYEEGEDLFIDIVAIDESGQPHQVFKSDISEPELA